MQLCTQGSIGEDRRQFGIIAAVATDRQAGSVRRPTDALDRFERRLDRMVNGAFARAFKAEVQPVEIAAALQRECDDRAAIEARSRELGVTDSIVLAGWGTKAEVQQAASK